MNCTRLERAVHGLAVFLILITPLFRPFAAAAQVRQVASTGGTIEGEVTTQNATIALGGVQILVFSDAVRVANVLSEGDGKFKIENLPPGSYRVTALLDGFQPLAATAAVVEGQTVTLRLDLPLAETVIVRGDTNTGVVPSTGTLSIGTGISEEERDIIAPGGGLQGALKLLVSAIEVPGGVAIKGGRPSQAGLQIGPAMFVDPATGLSQGTLPDDAIDSVTVLPNPYAVEFGRFSSGLVVVQTRRGTDKWRMRINNLEPSLRTARGEPLHVIGLQAFYPRAEIGGPLIKDKLFIQQSMQYKYRANDVSSRPEDELRTSHRFSSFTRMDANLSSRHSLVAVAGILPSVVNSANLGTFTPPDATVDLRNRVDTVAVTERAVLSDSVFSETTGQINRYHAQARPQGTAPMDLLPGTTLGNFFNRQDRTTSMYQFVQTVTGTRHYGGGQHQYKAGFDVLYSHFDGQSDSLPVRIRRPDGTLSRRLDFTVGGSQEVGSTDLAAFAQDRWQPGARWYLEFGGRIDRDGIISRSNVTPRVGTAVLLNASGSAVLRSGYGLFYERTPSAAGAFEQYEATIETRFADDGSTPLGPPQFFRHVRGPELETARSATWDLAYDHRLDSRWTFHIGTIDRRGSRELIVDPVSSAEGSELRMDSSGRSMYREVETSLHFTGGPGVDVNVSYVRSEARADLNAFTVYFDTILAPVVGTNAYAPARADTPHRLLARGRAMPFQNWMFLGVLDWRTGFPYSVVDEALDFVGPRNSERFPNYFRLDLGVEHRFKIGKYRPWIGVRADNALNSFLPADVQANRSSPAFGNFYNTEYREFRIRVRFER